MVSFSDLCLHLEVLNGKVTPQITVHKLHILCIASCICLHCNEVQALHNSNISVPTAILTHYNKHCLCVFMVAVSKQNFEEKEKIIKKIITLTWVMTFLAYFTFVRLLSVLGLIMAVDTGWISSVFCLWLHRNLLFLCCSLCCLRYGGVTWRGLPRSGSWFSLSSCLRSSTPIWSASG